jgi:AbrB family looped-hinge helix DNA binding protein
VQVFHLHSINKRLTAHRRRDAPPLTGTVRGDVAVRDCALGLPQPVALAQIAHPWHPFFMDATLVLGQQGRLVIPAEVRSALGLAPGDQLHLRLVGHSLVLERPQDAASELRGVASRVPRTRSLVDELLSERRHAAAVGE